MKLIAMKDVFNEFFFKGFDKYFEKYGWDVLDNERVFQLKAKNDEQGFRLMKNVRNDYRFDDSLMDEVIEIHKRNNEYLVSLIKW